MFQDGRFEAGLEIVWYIVSPALCYHCIRTIPLPSRSNVIRSYTGIPTSDWHHSDHSAANPDHTSRISSAKTRRIIPIAVFVVECLRFNEQ